MKRFIFVFVFLLLFLFSTLAAYFYYSYKKIYVGDVRQEVPINSNTPQPTPTPDPLGPKNVLLLGYAGGDHEGSVLTDTMIVVHIIPREDKVFLITIPRDIWVELPVEENRNQNFKINAAYAVGIDDINYPKKDKKYEGVVGGGVLAKEIVGEVVGMPIDNFISVNFQGFTNIINYFGGIEVNVANSLDDEYYPIKGEEENLCEKSEEDIEALEATLSGEKLEKEFKCRYEHFYIERGAQLMDAETALKYVRSRHSEIGGGDFGRSLRQQSFITALENRILNLGNITKIIPVINQITANTLTDINLQQAFDLLDLYGEVKDVEIETISLNSDNVLEETISEGGQFILVPKGGDDNWSAINEFITKEIEKFVDDRSD